MATDRDDRWNDDQDDDRRSRRSVDVEAARSRVSTPAILLILFGFLGILIEGASLGLSFSNPTIIGDQFKSFIDSQPNGPAKTQMQADYERDKDSYRLDTPMNIGGTIVGMLINVMMLFGGIKMKSLSGHTIAVIGAVCGIIPMGGCVCCAMPVGIWALIVLMNADVKAAFQVSTSR